MTYGMFGAFACAAATATDQHCFLSLKIPLWPFHLSFLLSNGIRMKPCLKYYRKIRFLPEQRQRIYKW